MASAVNAQLRIILTSFENNQSLCFHKVDETFVNHVKKTSSTTKTFIFEKKEVCERIVNLINNNQLLEQQSHFNEFDSLLDKRIEKITLNSKGLRGFFHRLYLRITFQRNSYNENTQCIQDLSNTVKAALETIKTSPIKQEPEPKPTPPNEDQPNKETNVPLPANIKTDTNPDIPPIPVPETILNQENPPEQKIPIIKSAIDKFKIPLLTKRLATPKQISDALNQQRSVKKEIELIEGEPKYPTFSQDNTTKEKSSSFDDYILTMTHLIASIEERYNAYQEILHHQKEQKQILVNYRNQLSSKEKSLKKCVSQIQSLEAGKQKNEDVKLPVIGTRHFFTFYTNENYERILPTFLAHKEPEQLPPKTLTISGDIKNSLYARMHNVRQAVGTPDILGTPDNWNSPDTESPDASFNQSVTDVPVVHENKIKQTELNNHRIDTALLLLNNFKIELEKSIKKLKKEVASQEKTLTAHQQNKSSQPTILPKIPDEQLSETLRKLKTKVTKAQNEKNELSKINNKTDEDKKLITDSTIAIEEDPEQKYVTEAIKEITELPNNPGIRSRREFHLDNHEDFRDFENSFLNLLANEPISIATAIPFSLDD